jgi:DNA-binding MarR family transcriptional regulator
VTDSNLKAVWKYAEALGPAPQLPKSLKKVRRRAALIEAIDQLLSSKPDFAGLQDADKQARLESVGKRVSPFMRGVEESDSRIRIALRLWVGCVAAAKVIALKTDDRPNTPATRAEDFGPIDKLANQEQIYRSGVEAAPAYKELLLEEYSLEGVPAESPVRKYVGKLEDRSMRLLQPKLVILYTLFKKGGVKNNRSELSRLLNYAKTGWTSTMVTDLQEEKFIEPKKVRRLWNLRREEYLVLTRRGKRKIAPLILVKYVPLFMALFALFPFLDAFDLLIFGIPIRALDLLTAAAAMIFLALFFYYEASQIEKEYYRL